MLIKALILNGYGRIHEILGYLISCNPHTVFFPVERLHFHAFPCIRILIVHSGGKVGRIAFQLKIGRRHNHILNISCCHTKKHRRCNDTDEHNGCEYPKECAMLFSFLLGSCLLFVSLLFQIDTSDVDCFQPKGKLSFRPLAGLRRIAFVFRPGASKRRTQSTLGDDCTDRPCHYDIRCKIHRYKVPL